MVDGQPAASLGAGIDHPPGLIQTIARGFSVRIAGTPDSQHLMYGA